MNTATTLIGCVCLTLAVGSTTVQAQPPEDDYVSRREHEALKRDFEALKAELRSSSRGRAGQQDQSDTAGDESMRLQLERTRLRLEALEELTETFETGTTNFVVTGYTFTNFFDVRGEDSSFGAGFNPIFLWKLSDQLLFKAELEVELEGDETHVALEYMDLSFVVNDYLTLSAGKFLTPLSNFKENLHPTWINKLPKQPMFASGGNRLIPTTSLGFQARGAVPIGKTKLTYAAYVSNGFSLQDAGDDAGKLAFKNFEDINNNKAIGGRIGFFPIPELEGFYAFNFADVAATGSAFGSVDALVQVFGLNYVTSSERIGGQLDLRFEYVLSDVDDVDFGSGIFDNEREGGYVQVAYRPTMAGSFFKDLEGVFRYDFIDQPAGAPEAFDIDRFTIGLNYWLSPSAVFKIAYQFEDVDDPAGARASEDGLLAQFTYGF